MDDRRSRGNDQYLPRIVHNVHGQCDAAVAFMSIASVNIYARTIIVYIIAGMANTDKRASNLRTFASQGRSEN